MDEIAERTGRLTASGNGASSGAFAADDLDWFLFHSFPGSEVDPARLGALLPVYERALAAGAAFDVELLYVRALELGDAVPAETRVSIARAAVRRALAGGFDAADAIASLRFALRVLPADEFLDRLLADASCERLRFHLTADFVLDERGLDDYLALSYLREGDPDADPVLARFPVPPRARERLAEFLAEAACRRRLEAGFARWTDPEERPTLLAALGEKLPGFTPR
jgi:hypothetical protein